MNLVGNCAVEAPTRQTEIEQAKCSIGASIESLAVELQELERRLVPVTFAKPSNNKSQESKKGSTPLGSFLMDKAENIYGLASFVRTMRENLEI